jgi:hypothetical protein
MSIQSEWYCHRVQDSDARSGTNDRLVAPTLISIDYTDYCVERLVGCIDCTR